MSMHLFIRVGIVGVINLLILLLFSIYRTARFFKVVKEEAVDRSSFEYKKKSFFHGLIVLSITFDIPLYIGFIIYDGYTKTGYSFHKLQGPFLFAAFSIVIRDWSKLLKDIKEINSTPFLLRRASLLVINVGYMSISLIDFALVWVTDDLNAFLSGPFYLSSVLIQISASLLLSAMLLRTGIKLSLRIKRATQQVVFSSAHSLNAAREAGRIDSGNSSASVGLDYDEDSESVESLSSQSSASSARVSEDNGGVIPSQRSSQRSSNGFLSISLSSPGPGSECSWDGNEARRNLRRDLLSASQNQVNDGQLPCGDPARERGGQTNDSTQSLSTALSAERLSEGSRDNDNRSAIDPSALFSPTPDRPMHAETFLSPDQFTSVIVEPHSVNLPSIKSHKSPDVSSSSSLPSFSSPAIIDNSTNLMSALIPHASNNDGSRVFSPPSYQRTQWPPSYSTSTATKAVTQNSSSFIVRPHKGYHSNSKTFLHSGAQKRSFSGDEQYIHRQLPSSYSAHNVTDIAPNRQARSRSYDHHGRYIPPDVFLQQQQRELEHDNRKLDYSDSQQIDEDEIGGSERVEIKDSAITSSVKKVNFALRQALKRLIIVMTVCVTVIVVQAIVLILDVLATGRRVDQKESDRYVPSIVFWTMYAWLPQWGIVLSLLYLYRYGMKGDRVENERNSSNNNSDNRVDGDRRSSIERIRESSTVRINGKEPGNVASNPMILSHECLQSASIQEVVVAVDSSKPVIRDRQSNEDDNKSTQILSVREQAARNSSLSSVSESAVTWMMTSSSVDESRTEDGDNRAEHIDVSSSATVSVSIDVRERDQIEIQENSTEEIEENDLISLCSPRGSSLIARLSSDRDE